MNNSYFAGFFDGEGCVCVRTIGRSFNLSVSVAQRDKRPLELFLVKFGGAVYRNSAGRCWTWSISGAAAAAFLAAIKPKLIVKKEQAILAIQLQKRISAKVPRTQAEWDKRYRMYQQIKLLKTPASAPPSDEQIEAEFVRKLMSKPKSLTNTLILGETEPVRQAQTP